MEAIERADVWHEAGTLGFEFTNSAGVCQPKREGLLTTLLLLSASEGIVEMKSLTADDQPITVARVLHIDDDPVFLDLVKGIFADDLSISVVSCLNALDALAIVESLQPALIISDISMPNMGGLELAHKLRQTASTFDTPIILVSAHTDALELYEEFAKMSDVALEKPVDVTYLRQQVKALLDKGARRKD